MKKNLKKDYKELVLPNAVKIDSFSKLNKYLKVHIKYYDMCPVQISCTNKQLRQYESLFPEYPYPTPIFKGFLAFNGIPLRKHAS